MEWLSVNQNAFIGHPSTEMPEMQHRDGVSGNFQPNDSFAFIFILGYNWDRSWDDSLSRYRLFGDRESRAATPLVAASRGQVVLVDCVRPKKVGEGGV
jgi:hypothetical protein